MKSGFFFFRYTLKFHQTFKKLALPDKYITISFCFTPTEKVIGRL